MNPAFDPAFADFDELLELLCEGRLSDEQSRRLEQSVVASDAACERYLLYLHLHGILQWDQAEPRRAAPPALPAAPRRRESPALVPISTPAPRRPAWASVIGFFNRPAVFSLIFASSFLFLGVTLMALFKAQTSSRVVPESSPHRVAAAPAAQWVAGVECVWEEPQGAAAAGDMLERGRTIRLAAGKGEIQFNSGAQLVVAGPAELVIERSSRVFLKQGRAFVSVPATARGFVLTTKLADIIDLGTEFAVAVAPTDETEVHIFTGSVRLEPLQGAAQILTANQALRLQPGDPLHWVRLPASRHGFVRSLAAANDGEPILAGSFDGGGHPSDPLACGEHGGWHVYAGANTSITANSDQSLPAPGVTELIDQGTQPGERIQISRAHSLADWDRAPDAIPYEWSAVLKFSSNAASPHNIAVYAIGFRDESGRGRTGLLAWYDRASSPADARPGLALVDTKLNPVAIVSTQNFMDGQFHEYRVAKYLDDGVMRFQVEIDGRPQFNPPLPYDALPLDQERDQGFGVFGTSPTTSRLVIDSIQYRGGAARTAPSAASRSRAPSKALPQSASRKE